MRYQFVLCVPALVASAPAFTENFLNVEQAQALIFPGAQFTPNGFVLNDAQIAMLMKDTEVPLLHREVKVWRVSTGGWFFLDQVIGRDDRIIYAVGLDNNGAVKGVEILTCLPNYDGIRRPEWLAHFVGKRDGKADLLGEFGTVSGSTLSSIHIADGVKRLLNTYTLFLAPKQG